MTKEKYQLPSAAKPWLSYYSSETVNVELPEKTVYEFMADNNRDYPEEIAVNYLGREISYQALFAYIDSTAEAFAHAGVKAGDIVTIALPTVPEALYSVYALNKLGAVSNMIHPLAGTSELLFYLNEVGSEVAVLFDKTYLLLRDQLAQTKVRQVIVVTIADSLPILKARVEPVQLPDDGSVITWQTFIEAGKDTPLPDVKKDPFDTAIISHTGGTTGTPKGVMNSDVSINAVIVQIASATGVYRGMSHLVVLPPFINYSLVNAMLEPISLGITCIMVPKYEPTQFYEYIKKYRPTNITSIPPYWEAMLAVPKEKPDLSCIKIAVYGGEAMAPQNEAAVNKLLKDFGSKCKLTKGLGMTELVCASTLTTLDAEMDDSVGIPLPKVGCMIADIDTDAELGFNQEGEICFSGPTLMIGYYNNREATDDIIRVHGDGQRWLHTGDLGYIDKNGILRITGRIKRIIMTRGKDGSPTKLFPIRIENAINSFESVRLSCVIGIPDEERINYPLAVVELAEGAEPSDELAERILKHCSTQLPEYSVPERIRFTAALPRTPRGKVDYRALEKQILGAE